MAYLFSNDKKNVQWKSVEHRSVLELFWLGFTQFKAGQIAVQGARRIWWLVDVASEVPFLLVNGNNGGP